MGIFTKKSYGCCLLISFWSIIYLPELSSAKLINKTYSGTVLTNICAYHNHAQRNNEEYSKTIRCHGSNTCFAMVTVQSLADGPLTVIRNQGCWKNDKELDCNRRECIIDNKDLAIGYTKQQFCCCTGHLCNQNLIHSSAKTAQATQVPKAATKVQPLGGLVGHKRSVRCSYYHKSNTKGNHTVGTVLCHGSSKCFSAVVVRSKNSSYRISIESQGCWQDEKSIPCHKSACIINSALPPTNNEKQPQFCCCYGNLCNTNLTYTNQMAIIPLQDSILQKMPQQDQSDDLHKNSIVLSAISSLFIISIFGFIGMLVWRYASVKRQERECAKHGHCHADGHFKYNRCPQLSMDNLCYGNVVYHGKFSTVQEATMGPRNIIVKIFPEESHKLWLNEKEIYTILNCHPQIAKLLAASEMHCDIGIQGMLVLENYSNGSLYNHLQKNTVGWTESMHFMLSLANGVAFIHGEIDEYSCNDRVIVAHRDITSQNVLIKDNGTCVLADFGIAVRIDGKEGLAIPKDSTLEYQPPEILTGAVNCHDCESSFKQADVYSMSMVLWEITSRCTDLYSGIPIPQHCLPYENELRTAGVVCNPDSLRDIVAGKMKRPLLPQCIENHPNALAHKLLFDTIEECWDPEPEARLTALCVVRRMQQIEPTVKKCDTLSGIGKLKNGRECPDCTVDASLIDHHSQFTTIPDGKIDHDGYALPIYAPHDNHDHIPRQNRYSADPTSTSVANSFRTMSSSVLCLGSDSNHQSCHSSSSSAVKTVSLPAQLYSHSLTDSDIRFL